MSNPYEPPQGVSENRLARLMVPGKYVGGFWGVAALGVLGGMLVGLMIYSEALIRVIPTPFIAPAVVWIGAFVALMSMLRGSEIHPATRVVLPVMLTIPAYILYVPVCSYSALFTTGFMGSDGYGPSFAGLVLSSIVAFVVVLLIFAAILRYRFKQPAPDWETPVSLGNQTDFSVPINEPSNE